ncbi:MAG: sialate O-acetylesterase [Smithella sp.]
MRKRFFLLLMIVSFFTAGCASDKPVIKSGLKYVLIVSGQSNAVGCAHNPLADTAVAGHSFTRTKIWVAGSWRNLNPADNTQSHNQAEHNHGIEPYFAYLFEQNFPNDYLFIIKFAEGGRSLAADAGNLDFYPTSEELYKTLKNKYIAPALASADLAGEYIPLGFWWMQGETDTLSLPWAEGYYSNLVNFFSTLAVDIPATAKFKRYIGQVSNNPHYPYRDKVRAAQIKYCTVFANNAALVATDFVDVNPNGDDIHYSAPGMSKLAKSLFTAMTGIALPN